jgi:hypothetical protein
MHFVFLYLKEIQLNADHKLLPKQNKQEDLMELYSRPNNQAR